MGLIKAGLGALGGVLADQWKEFFYCEALDQNVLMKKGTKQIGSRSSNTKGNDNIISNGSLIAVADGQCMIIVEQGQIVEVCAEPGEFTYDTSTEPSIFAGSLGQSIKETFKLIGRRFTFGGDTGKDQRVYYINTKEIMGNKFGTATPIPFRVVVSEELGFKLSVDLRCNGTYSYHITDPLKFYTRVCGNVHDEYTRDGIDEQFKADLLNALQPALATIASQKIQYYEISAHPKEVGEALKAELSAEWGEERGIELYKVSFNSVSIPEDQRQKITKWEETAMNTNTTVAGANLITSYGNALGDAANNENGAVSGLMGMGMVTNSGVANMAGGLFSMGQPVPNNAPAAPANGWTCKCGAVATGKFCPECGSPKP
ncbi:MAG: SPFH domain-containing protein, partial [Clostridia bacterium]|nr:SPFH domain-containing protein [Clostridia bacterium]